MATERDEEVNGQDPGHLGGEERGDGQRQGRAVAVGERRQGGSGVFAAVGLGAIRGFSGDGGDVDDDSDEEDES